MPPNPLTLLPLRGSVYVPCSWIWVGTFDSSNQRRVAEVMLHDSWDWFRKDYATSIWFFENAFGPQAPCCEEAQPGPYRETLWKDPETRWGGGGGNVLPALSYSSFLLSHWSPLLPPPPIILTSNTVWLQYLRDPSQSHPAENFLDSCPTKQWIK